MNPFRTLDAARAPALVAVAAAVLAALAGAAVAAPPEQAPANLLSLGDLEQRMTAQGITIREIELEQSVAEIEGRDAQGRKVELVVDRRSGEILARKSD